MTERTRQTCWQLVRFGLVGVANTAVYFALYRLLLLALPYLAAHLIAYAISVVFSFFMSCWFTYRVRPTWRRFVLFPLSVAVNFCFATFGTVTMVELVHVPQEWASLAASLLAIPFTFVTARYVLTGPHNLERIVEEAMETDA